MLTCQTIAPNTPQGFSGTPDRYSVTVYYLLNEWESFSQENCKGAPFVILQTESFLSPAAPLLTISSFSERAPIKLVCTSVILFSII